MLRFQFGVACFKAYQTHDKIYCTVCNLILVTTTRISFSNHLSAMQRKLG